MSNITAKFRCKSVTRFDGAPILENVLLEPVLGDNGENKQWSQWTPCGKLEMSISNPAAQGQIQAGQEYLITITPANIIPFAEPKEATPNPSPEA